MSFMGLALSSWLRIGIIVAGVAFLAWTRHAIYTDGFDKGRTAEREQTAELIREARRSRAADTQATLRRAQKSGAQHEASRTALDTLFDQLDKEARHEAAQSQTAADGDLCVLPAERLRLWQAANAGLRARLENPSTSEPSASAPSAATGLQWPPRGFGIQPPGGGQSLSPARQPNVQSAPVFGASP